MGVGGEEAMLNQKKRKKCGIVQGGKKVTKSEKHKVVQWTTLKKTESQKSSLGCQRERGMRGSQ